MKAKLRPFGHGQSLRASIMFEVVIDLPHSIGSSLETLVLSWHL